LRFAILNDITLTYQKKKKKKRKKKKKKRNGNCCPYQLTSLDDARRLGANQ